MFHVSLLKSYVSSGNDIILLELIVIDSHSEYEIDCSCAYHQWWGQLHCEFIVHWTSHDQSKDLWLLELELRHDREKFQQFWAMCHK